MATKITRWGVCICAAIVLQAPGIGARPSQDAKHEHEHPQAAATPADNTKPSTAMSATCQAMMAGHEKMMAEMKAADQRLDALVAQMTAASGQAKADATAAAVIEMVAQRKTMREGMMKMQDGMMSHMMEHMAAGKESMEMCPMMKMGDMKMKMDGMKH